MNAAMKINENAGDYGIAGMLDNLFIIMIFINVGLTIYFIMFMIIGFVRSIQSNLPEGDQGREE